MTTLVDLFGGSGPIVGHVSDSGGNWVDAPHFWFDSGTGPDMTVGGGVVTADAANAYAAVSSDVALGADCYIEATISSNDPLYHGRGSIGLGLRYNNTNGVGIFLGEVVADDATHLSYDIETWLGGSDGGTVVVSGGELVAVGDVTNCVMRIECEGSTIRVYGDGMLAHTYTSTHVLSAGTIGFALSRSTGVPSSVIQLKALAAGTLGSPPTIFWTAEEKVSEIDT